MKRVYENQNIRIFWDSQKCTHSANCVQLLPQVFNPRRHPWVDINAADAEAIRHCIDCCPSGALSYEFPGQKTQPKSSGTVIRIVQGGPYVVKGNCQLTGPDGQLIETGPGFSLCRCGASRHKPFCDGSHTQTGFEDEQNQPAP